MPTCLPAGADNITVVLVPGSGTGVRLESRMLFCSNKTAESAWQLLTQHALDLPLPTPFYGYSAFVQAMGYPFVFHNHGKDFCPFSSKSATAPELSFKASLHVCPGHLLHPYIVLGPADALHPPVAHTPSRCPCPSRCPVTIQRSLRPNSRLQLAAVMCRP